MKRIKDTYVKFDGLEGETLIVPYSNRGEPFREGIELTLDEFDSRGRPKLVSMFIEYQEAVQLRDLLNQLYPVAEI